MLVAARKAGAAAPPGSAVGDLTERLWRGQAGWKALGRGEAASLAHAIQAADLHFVTFDRVAFWRAAHEIGPRAWVATAWLRQLCVARPDLRAILEAIACREGRPLPLSWAE